MRRGGNAFSAVVDGLRGKAPDAPDWCSVIALANQALVTPLVFASLSRSGAIRTVPADVAEYFGFIHACNCTRNQRLQAQLFEAVAALNAQGMDPLLLKGAVMLFLAEEGEISDRIASDIDIAIETEDEMAARQCLGTLGYRAVAGMRGMGRPDDVGILELRPCRPDWFEAPMTARRKAGRVRIPPPLSRAMHLIAHDLLKEGDYWRGRLDLRHLHDLAHLAATERIDWVALRRLLPEGGARNAFDAQLLALSRLFGTEVPRELAERPMMWIQHWRRTFTASHPVIGWPLRLAGNLAWGTSRLLHADSPFPHSLHDLVRRIARTIAVQPSKL